MKKTEKISVLISIVLISLIAIGAVSAAEDTAAADDADLSAIDEVEAIDNTNAIDDTSYESEDIIVTDTGDSGDSDAISNDATKTGNLGANQLTDGDTLSFTNLSDKVSNGGFVQLKDNYVYNPTTDSRFVDGITITKDTTLMGNNGLYKIDGSNAARLFKIANGATLTLIGLTLTGGHADQGGAIYIDNGQLAISDSKFTGNSADYGGAVYATANGGVIGGSDFTNNVATYRGGAIYSEGTVDLSDSVIDSNDITYRARNDDNGGAAIYNNGGTLNLDGVQVTNNLKNIVIRNGNDGDLINAAIFTNGRAYITNSNISKNSGSWGAGIYAIGDWTLTVTDTTFEENMATFGAAIYSEGADVVVERCTFTKNHCEGVGSSGTSNTQGGAILIMSEGASAIITDSTFTQNSANTGGAVSISQATGDVLIVNCQFVANTASNEGGAIYNYAANGATLTVKDSTFQDNTATNFGDAISNDAALKLEGNTVTGGRPAAIGTYFGTVDSDVYVNILDGATVTTTSASNEITAILTDDNGNRLIDRNLVLIVDGNEVATPYDKATGIQKGTCTLTNPGTYEITAKDYDAAHTTTGTLVFESSLTSLQNIINENTNGTIDLTYGFAYIDSLDSALKETGIIVDKNIILNGNGVTIDGADVSRLFKVTNGATLTLNDVVLANGFAGDGADVYVDAGSKLTATGSTFKDSVATYSGGAIYALGEVSLTNCIVDNNDITDRSKNNNTGGAAIFLNKTALTLVNTNITNNGKNIVIRNTVNTGDLISGVVQLVDSNANIKGSLFKENAACYGGAINTIGVDQVNNFIVDSCTFIDNFAYNGAAINIEKSTFNIKNTTFKGNDVKGNGSSGTLNSCGGAIGVGGAGTAGIINNCTFEENTAEYAGGAIVFSSTVPANSVVINDSTFIKNQVTNDFATTYKMNGGAIDIESQGVTIANSTFEENYAKYRGAAVYSNAQYTTIDTCIFKNNEAVNAGGAIFFNILYNLVNNTEFYKNQVTAGSGGAIGAYQGRPITIDNSKFIENKASKAGGAIDSGSLSVTNTSFTSNEAGTYGGAVAFGNPCNFTECNFTSNVAATDGGAIRATNPGRIINSNFESNVAGTRGGAIYSSSTLNISGSNFTANQAVNGGAIQANGHTNVTASTFTANKATELGSAIYLNKSKTHKVVNSVFTGNTRSVTDHAIYNEGTLALSGNTVSNVIYNKGTITTPTYIVVLNNETKTVGGAPVTIDVVILDDNNNKITGFDDYALTVKIDDVEYSAVATLASDYVYEATFTPNVSGELLVTAEYAGIDGLTDNTLKTGVLSSIKGTYTDLMGQIEDAITNNNGVLNLPYDFTYNEALDGDALKDGIVINSDVTIVGAEDVEICGNELARVFKVTDGAALTLKDVTICHGAADQGAGVFVDAGATLKADNATFTLNTATTKGGAIYSEGTVDLKDSVIKENYISKRDGAGDENKGGAALYNKGGTATLDNVTVVDNLKDYANGNVLNGAVVAMGKTTITNSNFTNNYGRYGGAITQTETDETLTVENTIFEDNYAIFGGAIYDSGAPLVVKDSKFYNNSGVGPGSAGTSSSQGGAILVMGENAGLDLKGSEFINNTADLGGAVAVSSGTTGTFAIDDCTFTENKANDQGGAIYGYTTDSPITVSNSEFTKNNGGSYGGAIEADGNTDLNVIDSKFTQNSASYGGAIITGGNTAISGSTFTGNDAASLTEAIYSWYSGKTLALTGNTITDDGIQIYAANGVIMTTPLKVRILDNDTVNIHMAPYDITGVVTDDNGNALVYMSLRFKVGDDIVSGLSVDIATGVYKTTFTPTQTGEFVVSTNLADATLVETGVLKISRSLTDLANIIAAAEAGDEITLDGDYAYIPEFDADIVNGIVIDKAITIKGAEGADTISGSDLARLFKVVNGGTLTLDGVTIANGKADDGAGIYLESGAKLTATDSTFKDSTAKYSGGAIYADGAEISLTNCVLDGNDVTDYTQNNDTGGAAIYGNSATLALVNTNVTNNGNKELDRTKGDLINGVINLMNSDATVTGCVFENNTGIYGGAITTQAPAGAKTLTIKESNFTANAAYTGGAVYVGDNVKYTIEDSIFDANNKATGEGSPGYTSGGGAIQIWHAGEGTIDNVTIKNSIATQGGAIGVEGATVTIKDSTFEGNTATSEGGAIYAYNDATTTVTGCTFTDNDAPFGSAISNDGTLSLSRNRIADDYTTIPIANYYGTIVSPVTAITLNGDVVYTSTATNIITAVLHDDNHNKIIDKTLVLIVNGEEVTTSYDKITGVHTGTYTFTEPGRYAVRAKGYDPELCEYGAMIYTSGTFTELQLLINDAEEGATITLDHDIVYNAALDGDDLLDGIVVDKAVTIVGAEGVEICGKDLARVFKVTDGATLTLKDATICHGAAEKGAGVFVDAGASLVADNVTFTENVAVKRGGAIYSEGTVTIDNSRIDKNNVTFRTENDNNGGGAIYNYGGTLTVTDTNITDNQNDIVPREGNSGDYINSAIITTGDATFTGCNISKNSGSWGGGIYVTNDATLTIKDSVFEENYATFGAAVYVEEAKVIIDNSNFTDNHCGGVGSPGTSSTQAGAVLIMGNGASGTITNSKFEKNSAKTGGAVSISQATGDVLIDTCEFKENTASYEGGAIYNYAADGATLTVKDSTFTDNTASNWGDAISNDAALKLEGNTITGGRTAAIGNWLGTIDSKVYSTILANTTYNWHMADFVINATLTDDNGNAINDHYFKFLLSYTAFREVIEVPATYYSNLGYYQGTFTPTKAGEYLINLGYADEDVKTSVIKVYRSLTDLANIIAAAEDGATITLDGDYAYIPEFDADLVNGIVIDKAITIKGAEGADIINGSDLARLFKVTDGKTLTLDGVTIANGKADDGAGIYLESGAKLTATDSTFKDSTATYSGGAIYADGAEISLTNCVLDGNDVTDYTRNNDTGGAAIYGQSSTIALVNTNVTNNGNKELDRSKGDLVNGVINLMNSDATVTGCVFENNTGIYGGAITTQAPAGEKTLTISETNFTANAAYTGGAVYVGDNVKFTIEDSIFDANNKATGEGSPGYTSGGGAIQLWHAGEGTIDNVTIKNSIATQGGAIGVEGSSPVTIKDSTFTDNTATSEGGAIYAFNDAVLTVTDSTFSGNTAPWGNAISNDGKLTLSGNTISTTSADIANYYGSIVSPVTVKILGNGTDDGTGIVPAALGDTVTITAVVTDDNGNLIKDINFDFEVTNGDAVKEIHAVYNANTKQYEAQYVIANAGDHAVSMNYVSDNLVLYTGLYTVPKANVTFVVNVENIPAGEKAKVDGQLIGANDAGLEGMDIVVVVNGVDYNITTGDNGTFSFEIEDLPIGQYEAVGIFYGTDNYNRALCTDDFNVTKLTPVLAVEGEEYLMPGATATVGITLTGASGQGIEGTVIVTVDGKDYVVYTDASGKADLEIPGLVSNVYPITAKFIGNDNYETAVNDTESIEFYYKAASFDIVIDDITYGDAVVITVENVTDLAGNPLSGMVFGNIVSATGDGAGLSVYVTDGSGTATISRKLSVGTYDVVATFTDDYYEYISETKEFTFDVSPAVAVITTDVANYPFNETGKLNINVVDLAGTLLNGTVSVQVDDEIYALDVEVVNGTAVVDLTGIDIGEHSVVVTFANPNYRETDLVDHFNVTKVTPIVEVNDTEAEWGTSVDIPVKVTDESGNPVTGTVIVIVDWLVDGKSYVVELDENGMGTAHFVINEATGDLTITARFIGNDNFTDKNATATLTITESTDLEIEASANEPEFGEDTIITVTGKDGMGAVVPITAVNVTIDGVTTEYPVADDGTVNLGKLPVGETEITVSVDDGKHKAATETINVTVDPAAGVQLSASAANYAIGETGTLIVTVKDKDGKPLDGPLYIEIDGEIYVLGGKAIDGGAEIALTNLDVGDHVAVVTFANSSYLTVDYTTHFTVTKATPVITVTGDVIDLEEVATVNVTVMDGTTPVSGNAVVTVNGVSYAVTIAADGRGFVDIENLPFGEYPITAKFLANDKYEAAVYSGDAKVVVNMPTDVTFDLAVDDGLTTVTVSDATNAAGEAIDGYIMGVLMKDGQKVATLDMGTLADGTGTLALPADLGAGDYTVMVTVKDEDMKLTGTDEINFTVEPKAAVVTGDAADYAFDQTGKLEINVTDVAETPIAGNVTVVIDEGPYATVEINGNTVIDLTGFDIGAHIVKVIFTNPNYRDAEWVGGFNVTKVTPTITVTGDVVDFEEVATVNVTVMAGETPVAGNAVVTVNGVNYAVTIGADGKGFVDIENLPFGEYPITAKFLANDKYEEAVYSGNAKVVVNMPTDVTFDLAVDDDLTTVTVSNAKDAAGDEIDGYVMGELLKDGQKVQDLEFGTLEEGTGTIAIPAGLEPGDYTVLVTVMDSEMELTGSDEINFTVAPKDTASVTVGTNDENITIEAKDGTTPLAGTALVSIDGADPITVPVGEDGKANVPLGDLAPGQHTVEVTFTNDNYEPVTEVATITVPKGTPVITVTGSEVDFGQDATVTVTVKDGETPVAGNAVVTVNGVNYAVEIGADGTGTLTIAGLAANEYPIAAKFLANDKYEEAVYSGDAKVVVGPSKDLTIEVTANEPSVGQDTIITVTATDGSGAAVPVDKVNVTIDGVTTEYPVAADGTVNIGALPAGETPVTVSVDDGVHTLATKDITAVVSTPTVLGTNITVTVDNITYGESAVIKFTLTDENNNPLTGILNVTVKDMVKEVPVDDGHGTLTLPSLTADTYPVVANFEGNDAYGPSTGTGYFNVAKKATKIIYENMTTNAIDFYTDGRVGEWFVWRLVDEDGNPMKNTPMQIGFNGIVYTYEENGICTDDDGYARLQINLMTSFTYTFAISFLGDENYNASFAVAKIDVLKQTPTITVPNKSYKASASTKTLTATFKNNRGTLIANKTIKFTVNGKTYSAKTDEKGVAKVNVSISKKGTYDVTMTYGGSGTYEKVTKKATLKIT